MKDEALRQQALVAELFGAGGQIASGCAQHGERRRRGVAAYRANAAAIAERVIAARHPVLGALVGDETLAALARSLWRAEPPRRGDLACWGDTLAAYIEVQAELSEWPYLGDVARLEAAIAHCESCADAAPEPATLALLSERAPAGVKLRLQPHVHLLVSRWPIARIHAAHVPGASTADFEAARRALALGEGDAVVVWRRGWRAIVERIDQPVHAWMDALAHGDPLDEAHDIAGAGFDLGAWLARALVAGWLWRAETL